MIKKKCLTILEVFILQTQSAINGDLKTVEAIEILAGIVLFLSKCIDTTSHLFRTNKKQQQSH